MSFSSFLLLDMKDDAVLLVGDFTAVCVFTLCFGFCYSGGCEPTFQDGLQFQVGANQHLTSRNIKLGYKCF